MTIKNFVNLMNLLILQLQIVNLLKLKKEKVTVKKRKLGNDDDKE